MYFEARTHRRRDVASAAEAARLIHTKQARECEALIWRTADGRELAAVSDVHIDCRPFGETAVLDLSAGVQIESITMGWIDSEAEKLRYLVECETEQPAMRRAVRLPLDGTNEDLKAWFGCACCGESFQSTIKAQRVYDQDSGHGICPGCAHLYRR